jgi:hypothetical protein
VKSHLVERVFTVVFFTTVGLTAFGLLTAAAGLDGPWFEPLAVVLVVGLVLLFGGGVLLVLFAFREGMLVLIRGEGNRLDRFARWSAQNTKMEDQAVPAEDSTPTRSETIGVVVMFVVYFGFNLALVGFIAWQVAAHLV